MVEFSFLSCIKSSIFQRRWSSRNNTEAVPEDGGKLENCDSHCLDKGCNSCQAGLKILHEVRYTDGGGGTGLSHSFRKEFPEPVLKSHVPFSIHATNISVLHGQWE